MMDILIAGGGIAGSALAILLGRQGVAVELFERGQFPKEKPCGEGLMPAGVAVLRRLGLAEAAGGVPFHGVRYHFGRQTAEGRFPEAANVPCVGYAQRRRHLDKVLFDAAAGTLGVTTHTGAHVDAPLCEDGRVAGLIVDGEPRRASLVVAADGAQSRIRHLLGLDVALPRKRFGVCAHFRLAPDQPQASWVDVFLNRGRELYVTPLPDSELLVAALADAGALGEPIEMAFRKWCSAEPSLASRLDGATRIGPLFGAFPLAGRARIGVAPGVVLLGDAAGFTDPITGGGMAQALMSAELLGRYVARGLTAQDDWIWSFERERQAMLRDYRRLTQMVLWLADRPRLAAWSLSALRHLPAIFSHLMGVSGGVRRLFGPSAPNAAESGGAARRALAKV